MDVRPCTLVVWGDVTCPWATLAVHRLHEARSRLGLDADVRLDLRAFPLELFNGAPTPRKLVDAEIGAVGALAPDFGWQIWQAEPSDYPSTVLLALEAVQAAKTRSLVASEQLDLALRHAFFSRSRHVGMRDVILDAATRCPDVDAVELAAMLDDGSARHAVMEQYEIAQGDEVKGSPHVFLPDGSSMHNPGIEMHWEGEKPAGFPVIDADDPSVYDDLVQGAAASG